MLIPRFTLRWLLGLTTVCAAGSLVVSMAVRGEAWAIGATAALGAAALVAVLFVVAFLVAWLIAQIERALFGGGPGKGVSPFADQRLPDSPFGPAGSATPPAADVPPSLTG